MCMFTVGEDADDYSDYTSEGSDGDDNSEEDDESSVSGQCLYFMKLLERGMSLIL